MNINNMCPSTIVNSSQILMQLFFRKYNANNYFTERNAALKQHVLKAANSDAGGDWRPRDSDRKTEKTMNTINYLSL